MYIYTQLYLNVHLSVLSIIRYIRYIPCSILYSILQSGNGRQFFGNQRALLVVGKRVHVKPRHSWSQEYVYKVYKPI